MVFVCMVKDCQNSSKLSTKKCKMFSIPKDGVYYKDWLINCNRQDLMEKSLDVLHKYYRVCSDHFKKNMFSGPEKTSLLPKAIPTEFGAQSSRSSCPIKSSSTTSSTPAAEIFSFHTPKKKKSKWSLLISRNDMLDDNINSPRVCSNSFDKVTLLKEDVNVQHVNEIFPMKVIQKNECNKIPSDISSVTFGKHSTPEISGESSNCFCISTSSSPSNSQTSTQISPLLSLDIPNVRSCKSKDSDNDNKLKFFKFSKDEPCSLMWVQAVNRENLVSKNNSMNCNVNLSNGAHKKKLNLMKLSRRAVPSILNPGNVGQNIKPKIIVMNSNCKTSLKPDRKYNILSDHTYVCSGNVKLQKSSTNSDSKSLQKHAKKCYDKLSDHSYVLKLPTSSNSDEISSENCTVQDVKVNKKVCGEPTCVIDLTESDNSTSNIIENPSLVQLNRNNFKNAEIDWKKIVSTQSIIIKELRKKVKVLQQKIRRYNTKLEALKTKEI